MNVDHALERLDTDLELMHVSCQNLAAAVMAILRILTDERIITLQQFRVGYNRQISQADQQRTAIHDFFPHGVSGE